jgi:hypothetical protein
MSMDTFKETDLEVIVDGQRCLAEGLGASWVDGQGIKATRRAPAVDMWVHAQDTALPFPFTLAQFRAFCDWHPTFEWEAIKGPFTNDDGTLDEAALAELATRGADAAQLVRQVLGVRGIEPAFEVLPCPLDIPPALLALAPDTAVTALRHWFDFAIGETTNAGQLKSEIEQRIKDQTTGLFSIDEAACIAADAIGADRKKTRQAIWKAIDDGALVPLWNKARTPLPLPLTGTDKSLALMRTDELANVFEAWPLKPEPQPAPTEAGLPDDAWKEEARAQARAIIERQAAMDWHPNLVVIADEIAKEWRKLGKFGPKGMPLSGGYIKRHALQGHGIGNNRKTIISTSKGRGK